MYIFVHPYTIEWCMGDIEGDAVFKWLIRILWNRLITRRVNVFVFCFLFILVECNTPFALLISYKYTSMFLQTASYMCARYTILIFYLAIYGSERTRHTCNFNFPSFSGIFKVCFRFIVEWYLSL